MKKIIQASLTLGIILSAVLSAGVALAPASVYATHPCEAGTRRAGQPIPHNPRQAENFCAGGGISQQEAAEANRQAEVDCTETNLNSGNCKIYGYLVMFIRALSGLVGIVVVIMVAVGGIQYAASKDNPQATAAAKNRIKDAILALVMYIFMFAFLQWIVPGGVV